MSVSCCLRCVLTVLHALTGLGAGFVCMFSLFGWNYETTCFPALIDTRGDPIPFRNGLLVVCESLVYGMAAVSLFNLASCFIINWQWQSTCIAFINLMLSIIYVAFAVMGGTTIVVYYVVWCDTLQRKFVSSHGCEDAARQYDTYNVTAQMSMYKSRMEVQMASIWALFPITGIVVIVYSLTMRLFAKPDTHIGQLRYIVLHDEATPLLSQDNTYLNENTNSTSTHNMVTGSTNPFDN